ALGTLPNGLRELHVAHAVLEGRARDLLAAADRVDELFLDAPADAALRGDRDLAQGLVAAPSAGDAPGVGLDPERALRPEDPHLAGRSERRDRAEAHVRRCTTPQRRENLDVIGHAHVLPGARL